MADKREPSYTDLVHEVLRLAGRPLTFQEIFEQVNLRRAVSTRNPKGTVRNALSQSKQLVSLGDGRYGYLPHLVRDSLLRLPLAEKKPANYPLVYPEEVLHALWPGFFESQKRKLDRPARLRLPNGEKASISLEFLGTGTWGSPMPEPLRRYLIENQAAAGDSLLIQVHDGEAGECAVWFESRLRQDRATITRRDQELADAAYQLLQQRRAELPVWDLAMLLLGRGAFRSEVAPQSLVAVLGADSRFTHTGLRIWMLTEAVTPEMQALILHRKQLEGELTQLDVNALTGREPAVSPLPLPFTLERTTADLGALLSEQEFGSIDEARAFLQELLVGGGVPRRSVETPLARAQDLVYDAWETASPRQRVRLARQALEISPDCADAYVLLAEETAQNPREAADLYARGVAAGERVLGLESFKQDVGHFWGIIETRPYMRARHGLAQALWDLGQRQEAITHLWDMLRLNPGDNQGVRYVLLNWLLEVGEDNETKKLLKRYPDDAAAEWLYGRALHAFRTEGDTSRARKLRAEAERENPHVPAYLVGRKRLPGTLPETVGFGDDSEAIVCAAVQMPAWRKTPGALAWLDPRGRRG